MSNMYFLVSLWAQQINDCLAERCWFDFCYYPKSIVRRRLQLKDQVVFPRCCEKEVQSRDWQRLHVHSVTFCFVLKVRDKWHSAWYESLHVVQCNCSQSVFLYIFFYGNWQVQNSFQHRRKCKLNFNFLSYVIKTRRAFPVFVQRSI